MLCLCCFLVRLVVCFGLGFGFVALVGFAAFGSCRFNGLHVVD